MKFLQVISFLKCVIFLFKDTTGIDNNQSGWPKSQPQTPRAKRKTLTNDAAEMRKVQEKGEYKVMTILMLKQKSLLLTDSDQAKVFHILIVPLYHRLQIVLF